MNEIWKDIPGYEGLYQASILGDIRSVDRMVRTVAMGVETVRISRGTILKQRKGSSGYLQVGLHQGSGIKHARSVHRLVALTFIEDANGLPEVNHIDGCKTNNAASNLEWCTALSNRIHASKLGLTVRGERVSGSKLTEMDIPKIKQLLSEGFSTSQIARAYSVTQMTIWHIGAGKTWKHIGEVA